MTICSFSCLSEPGADLCRLLVPLCVTDTAFLFRIKDFGWLLCPDFLTCASVLRHTSAQKLGDSSQQRERKARVKSFAVCAVTLTHSCHPQESKKRNACACSWRSKQPGLSEGALLSGRGASASVRGRRRCARHPTSGPSRRAGPRRSKRK